MRKTALLILLVGFAFAFFFIPFAGIDLLLDPVGWLLVWNSLRALRLKHKVFGASVPVSMGLVVVSALRLFLGWAPGQTILAVLEPLLLIALFLLLARAFASLLAQEGHPAARKAALCVLPANLLPPLLSLLGLLPLTLGRWVFWLSTVIQVALLALLLRLAFLLDENRRPTAKS